MQLIVCPFCKSKHFTRLNINVLCHCGAKFYIHNGLWLNRKTGEEVKEPDWPVCGKDW